MILIQIEAKDIIGQFGVGFYSAFMVANNIEVYSRSSQPGSQGFLWQSDGSGKYTIQVEGMQIDWNRFVERFWYKSHVLTKGGGGVLQFSCNPWFLGLEIYVKIRLFSFLTYVLRLKPSLKITNCMKVAKLPPPPF